MTRMQGGLESLEKLHFFLKLTECILEKQGSHFQKQRGLLLFLEFRPRCYGALSL